MNKKPPSDNMIREGTISGLHNALVCYRPNVPLDLDKAGYVLSFEDNLLPLASPADFEAELRRGAGHELECKFLAAHSSSALAVNCFAPFRCTRRIGDLTLPLDGAFSELKFEYKCPTGLRGNAPNLDVLLCGVDGVVGVESKLTEYMSPHTAGFAGAYVRQFQDKRSQKGYFGEMRRLMGAPKSYRYLDAAQLIKHAFGLGKNSAGQSVTLLYLYWEPENPECHPIFEAHRREIEEFESCVTGSTPKFKAMSYPELWAHWRTSAPPWLSGHLDELAKRYAISLPY